jgi:NTE family protein
MYGLVLQGGGTKGSYHIGVWKALKELGVEIGAVTGTSIGALNGAFVAQDTYDLALKVWENIEVNDVIDAESEVFKDFMHLELNLNRVDKYFEYFKRVIKDKGLDTSPLRKLIENNLDEKRIRESGIDFGLVTVSLTDMKPLELFVEDIEVGKLTEYLLASSFLPGFKPQQLDGKRFVDGGVYDNLPINLIARKGYTDIIAVEMDSIGMKQNVDEEKLNVIRIRPSDKVGRMLQFDRKTAKRNIQMGYLDTMKVLGQYGGIRYYFKNLPDESYFLESMLQISSQDIMTMASDLGYSEGEPRRILFEKLIPELAEMFNLKLTDGYREITLTLVEYLAEVMEIERLAVYEYEQFEREVISKAKTYKTHSHFYKDLPLFFRKAAIVKHTLKDDILIRWAHILMESYLAQIELPK